MSIDRAFAVINESVELVLEKILELSEENGFLRKENAELRKLVGELMLDQLEMTA